MAIVGPTASGKSTMAMRIAEQVGAEVVSCDSVQVYRGFDIGSAKPSPEEQRQVAHHGIDLVHWHEPFDAQRYVAAATDAMSAIVERGRVPIVCGGTGLYLRALRFGLMPAPKVDEPLRQELLALAENDPDAIYAKLQKLDPESAGSIPKGNKVQVVRALELCLSTGTKASVLRSAHGFKTERLPMQVFVLDWPKERLRARIEQRVKVMLEQGLVDEVRDLLQQNIPATARPMAAVGYREVVQALRLGHGKEWLTAAMVQSTVRYAKRQRTWFRKEPGAIWLPMALSANSAVKSENEGFLAWQKWYESQGKAGQGGRQQ